MKKAVKSHLKKTICNTLNAEANNVLSYGDNTNRVNFREIICNLDENTAILTRKNIRTKENFQREIGLDELLTLNIEETLEFDMIIEGRY